MHRVYSQTAVVRLRTNDAIADGLLPGSCRALVGERGRTTRKATGQHRGEFGQTEWAVDAVVSPESSEPTGSRTVNVDPSPWTLVTVRSPPIRRQKWRLIASPSPVPPYRLRVDASAWENASNSFPSCSVVIPMPV